MTKFKRTRIKKVDAILMADPHIGSTIPECRMDSFFDAKEKKLDKILDLSKRYECPILIAGDIGDKPQWKNWLLEWIIGKFYGHNIIAIPGQHDLPNHRLSLWEKSGIGVLAAAEVITLLGPHDLASDIIMDSFQIDAFPYGEKIHKVALPNKKLMPRKIAMTHQMVIEDKKLWPGQDAPKGHQLLKKYPEYDLILSGDNHQPFVVEHENRLLVNPGSMMRIRADQIDHRPRVYLWDAKQNKVEPVFLPIESGVVSRDHIEKKENRDSRMSAFVTSLDRDYEIGHLYKDNLKNHFAANRTRREVSERVWESVEGEEKNE